MSDQINNGDKSQIKILFVEDLDSDFELAKHALRNEGLIFESYRVLTEPEMEQALSSFNPHLVISDYTLPQFDGMRALKTLLRSKIDIPFIILTGSLNEEIAVECIKAGASDYVIKDRIKRLPFAVMEAIKQSESKKEKILVEELIKENEIKYRNLFNNNPQPMWIYDIETLSFLEVNTTAINHYSFTREEFLKMSIKDIMPESDIDLLIDNVNKQDPTISNSGEWRHTKKNGEVIFVEISSYPLEFNGKKARHVIVNDITAKKRTELALKQSEDNFHRSLNESPLGIRIVSRSGETLYTNKALLDIFGYSSTEEYINTPSKQIYTPESLKQHNERRKKRKIADIDREDYMVEIIRKDGSKRHIHVIRKGVVWNNEKQYQAIYQDITEQKLTEEDNRTLSHAIKSINDCVSITDLENRIIFVNDAFAKTFGYSIHEVIGKSMEILNSPKNPTGIHSEIYKKTLNGGWQGELWNKRMDGSELQISLSTSIIHDDKGNNIALVGISNDITEEKKNRLLQEIILNISQAANTDMGLDELIKVILSELERIVDTKNFYIAFYDKHTDTFTTAFMLDEKDEFKTWPAGKSISAYVLRNQSPTLLTKDDIAVLSQNGALEVVGTLPEIWMGVPLVVKGQPYGVFAVQHYLNPSAYNKTDLEMLEIISHQISISIERKKNELDLIAAKEKAEESDRLKSSFLANLSHEIRTPMNAIIGFTDMLKTKEVDILKRMEYIDIVQKSGLRLLDIITETIEISKIDVGQIKLNNSKFNLNQLITDISNELRAIIPPEKELEVFATNKNLHEEVIIDADKTKIQQVLINLISNGIKYTPRGAVSFGYEFIDNNLQFKIQDTGIGIKKEDQEIIFKRFFRVENPVTIKESGIGLGLSITKAFIELMGGTLTLESDLGMGTTVIVNLPITKQNVKEIAAQKNKAAIQDGSGKIILVAEDDEFNFVYINEVLKNNGYRVIHAPNGKIAVELMKSNSTEVKLILMDLKMPIMNGFIAFTEIRKFNKTVPIVAQTAYVLADEQKQIDDWGFNAQISKPLRKNNLLEAVQKYIMD